MNVVRDYLAPGQGARPGHPLADVRGLVIHWIGAAEQEYQNGKKEVTDIFRSFIPSASTPYTAAKRP